MPQNPSLEQLVPKLLKIEPEVYSAHQQPVAKGEPTRKRRRAPPTNDAAQDTAAQDASTQETARIADGARPSKRSGSQRRPLTREALRDCSNESQQRTTVGAWAHSLFNNFTTKN